MVYYKAQRVRKDLTREYILLTIRCLWTANEAHISSHLAATLLLRLLRSPASGRSHWENVEAILSLLRRQDITNDPTHERADSQAGFS